MRIDSADGSYETLVKLPDDEVGERWLVRAGDGGLAMLVRLSPARAAVPSDRNGFLLRVVAASRAVSSRVRIPIDRGESEGRPFAVFPYRFDLGLRTLLARLHGLGRRLTPTAGVALGVALAESLESVHGTLDGDGDPLRLVHGGIRTERVRIAFAADVELDALGLARPAGSALPEGTDEARFAAPEQSTVGPTDPRSDVFAIAAVVWEALAARRFDPTLARTALSRHVPDATEDLEIVLGSALDPDPANRPASLSEFVFELRRAVPDVAAFDLRSLAVLAASAVGPEVARAPFATDPAVSAILERDRPPADPAVIERTTLPIVPGIPADLGDGPVTRSVFGSRAPTAGLTGSVAPARVSLKKVAVAAPNPVAAAPQPGAGNARDRANVSAPPPRAASVPPPAANPAPTAKAPSKRPPPPPPSVRSAKPGNPAREQAAPVAVASTATTPGGFGAPAVPTNTSPWMKQGAPLPAGSANRSSAPPPLRGSTPPPPPAAERPTRSSSAPPSVVPPPPPSLLAAVADSPFAPIPPLEEDEGSSPALDGLFGAPEAEESTLFGARPLELGAQPAPPTVRPVAPRPNTMRPVNESIPLRADSDDDEGSGRKKLVLLGLLAFVTVCGLAFGLFLVFADRTPPAPAPVAAAPAEIVPPAPDAPDEAIEEAPAAVVDSGVDAGIADAGEEASLDASIDGAAEEIAAGDPEMVFDEAPTSSTRRATMRSAPQPARELSFRERRALRRAERRGD